MSIPCPEPAFDLRPDLGEAMVRPAVQEPSATAARLAPWQAKRAFDLVTALTLVLLFGPLLLALAAAVRLSGPGPVIYRQRRVGRGGREFVVLKFRSMVAGADIQRAALLSRNEADGPLFKLTDDPRITGVGRWMRRYSLDELPQLFNVVGGSMSLVGPRPALPEEVARYTAQETRRLWAKPGMTGLWQVSGRSDLGWHEGIELDLRYVEQWTIAMDLMILLRTLPAVLLARGAY